VIGDALRLRAIRLEQAEKPSLERGVSAPAA
jgi:hypothetical protein